MSLGSGCSERVWEQWQLKLSIREPKSQAEQIKFRAMLEKNMQSCLIYVATMSSEFRDHVPIAAEADNDPEGDMIMSPFYRINVPGASPGESWGGIFKKMISETASIPNL